MPRITAIGVPLLRLGARPRDEWQNNVDPSIVIVNDRFIDVDPSTFTPELVVEYDNLRMRGLIGLHPDDNGGIPVGKTERATIPKRAGAAAAPDPGATWSAPKSATPMPAADPDEEDESPAPSPETTRDETPSKRRR